MSAEVKIFDPKEQSQTSANVTMTEAAITYVQKKLRERGHGIGLRLRIKKSGCSGWKYVVDYVDEAKNDDQVSTIVEGLVVVVDAESVSLVQGTTIDFVKHNLTGGKLKFIHPNEKSSCGCGESFSV